MNVIVSRIKKKNFNIAVLVFIALLILRFFPYNILEIQAKSIRNIYYNGTYILTAIFIFIEREKLKDFYIDTISISIFIISPIASAIFNRYYSKQFNQLSNIDYPTVIIFTGIILAIALIVSPTKINKRIGKVVFWIIAAAITGLILSRLQKILEPRFFGGSYTTPSGLALINMLLANLNRASIMEEPLFRGFLCGYLRILGIKERWILLIQAFIFTFSHYGVLGNNDAAVIFIFIFVWGLVYGFFSSISKSIAPSMVVHGLIVW
jgi:membrane protease YdiL (CAAX protease family)